MSKVFISYAWGGESEDIANALEKKFQEKGIKLVKDKTDLGYKGLIKQFMQQIGQGKCVVAIVSDKYLKSKNCMYELLEISRNGEFYDRIFPIVLKDARIYDALERLNYIRYWEDKIKELEKGMKSVGLANLQGFREEIDLYTEIRKKIAELVDTLQNMNTLIAEMHKETDFGEMVEAIAKRIKDNTEGKDLGRLTPQELLDEILELQKNRVGRLSNSLRIKNKASGLYLGVAQASLNSGERIIQWNWQDDGSQNWYFEVEQKEGYIHIINDKSGLYAGVREASTASGQDIIQWEKTNDGSQEWLFFKERGNEEYFQIQNLKSGKVLEIKNSASERGEKLIQSEKTGKANQLWSLESIA